MIEDLAEQLVQVDGVVGVTLGGSRARGTALPGSDVDLGVYYRPPLDTRALAELATRIAGRETPVTEPGAWGPWVDGGAWLTVEGLAVDWIYRDLGRVREIWADCTRGRVEVGYQNGHPLGFYSHIYAGELALGRVLADPSGELTALRADLGYPPALRAALIERARGHAPFALAIARKSVTRQDAAYVAGCLFQAFGVLAHALHAHAGRWLINEKNAVAESASLPAAPRDFAARVHGLFGALGESREELGTTLGTAEELVTECLDNLGRAAG
ncbi:nucleotidyltransferase domain-containing protein [Nonomuraea typhae]|uniref:nucleotidyltransferase domain-containing protein n=1 Tax=Nonomuraea typhae TaxID=2603600 RepID=UPI0012F8FBA2|nr:nucleotidyltransferase domain-containing protein [Nonomuraea typhae]